MLELRHYRGVCAPLGRVINVVGLFSEAENNILRRRSGSSPRDNTETAEAILQLRHGVLFNN